MAIRPTALNVGPSVLMLLLGGLVGTLLLSALLFAAPVFGFPFVDIPHLVGGIFTESPAGGFWLGFWLFFLTGWLVFAPALLLVWHLLPGEPIGFVGALIKGLLWGTLLWVLSGVLLPVFGWLNQIDGLENPGFFALGEGVLAALGVLLGHLAFGAAVALVAAMAQGIAPLDTLGWMGYRVGPHEHAHTQQRSTYGA